MEFLTIFLRFLIMALYAVLLARVVWSWVDPTFRGPLGRFVFESTEPILSPIRRFLPQGARFDFSPIVAFVLLTIVAGILGLR